MYQSSKRSASLCVNNIKKTFIEMEKNNDENMDGSDSSSSSSYCVSDNEDSINDAGVRMTKGGDHADAKEVKEVKEDKETKEDKEVKEDKQDKKAKEATEDVEDEDEDEEEEDEEDVINFSDMDDDEDEDEDVDVDEDELSEEGREMLEGDDQEEEEEEENEDDKFRVIRPGEICDLDEDDAMVAHDLDDDDDMCDHSGERMTPFYKHFMMTVHHVVFHLCFSKLPELLSVHNDKNKHRAQYDGRPLYEYHTRAMRFFDLCEKTGNAVDSKLKAMTDRNPRIEIVYGIIKRVLGSHLIEAHPAVGILPEDHVKEQNCATTGCKLEYNSEKPGNPNEAWCVIIHTHKNKSAGGGTNEYSFVMSARATKTLFALNYIAQFKRMLYNHASEQIYIYNTTPNLIVTDYASKYLQTQSRWIDYHFAIFEEARKTVAKTFEIQDLFAVLDE